mmetsp:Transcript_1206/g.1837  ORF Transcript_1206/g.1837 Transcript_1206/m.1837 type:complete len:210 (+) Transcript_1206:42-671(+)
MKVIIATLLVICMVIASAAAGNVVLTGFNIQGKVFAGFDGCVYVTSKSSLGLTCDGETFTTKTWENSECSGEPRVTIEKKDSTFKCVPGSDVKLQIKAYTDNKCERYLTSLMFLETESCSAYLTGSRKYSITAQKVTYQEYSGTTKCEGDASTTITFTLDQCKEVARRNVFNTKNTNTLSQKATTHSAATKNTMSVAILAIIALLVIAF